MMRGKCRKVEKRKTGRKKNTSKRSSIEVMERGGTEQCNGRTRGENQREKSEVRRGTRD